MIALFNYYDLKIYLAKQDYSPVHVYARRDNKANIGIVQFEKGLFKRINIAPVEGLEPLDEVDVNRLKLLIINNLAEVIKRWIDYHIYDRTIAEEIIKQRIEDAPFSS